MSRTYVNKGVAVGITALNVLPDRKALNQKRTSLIITNISAGGEKIYLSVAGQATLETGILLAPGGHWEQTLNGDYLPPQHAVSAICDGAGGKLSVYEEAE